MLSEKNLLELSEIKPLENQLDFDNFIERGIKFRQYAASTNSWSHNLVLRYSKPKSKIMECVNSSYPILHESILPLIQNFIEFKKKNGHYTERYLYKNMSLYNMIDRLIKKRPLSFYGRHDKCKLRDGEEYYSDWNKKLNQIEYMSYDEIKLAAFIQVSSPVLPINSGARKFCDKVTNYHVDEAVYVGAVGARLHKNYVMEHQEIICDKNQNTIFRGYGKNKNELPTLLNVFADFYGIKYFPEYTNTEPIFNSDIYIKRIKVSIETFLIEANSRGSDKQKVYAHIVGLGLGKWSHEHLIELQTKLYLDACNQVINELNLENISDIDFSYISDNYVFKTTKPINIIFSKRNPFDKIDSNKLVVAMYAWDGNAYPGNEYWCGLKGVTGDSTAACCTQIPEFQNSDINELNICVNNLKISSKKYGLVSVSDYALNLLKKK